MRYSLPGNNIKIFSKAIHCLVKLGNEIYFQCERNALTLKTVSMSRSAFASCKFASSFFDDISELNTNFNESCNLKVSTKTLLHIFRSLATIDRTVNTCEITFNNDKDSVTFMFYCKHEVTKSFNIFYQECDALDAVFFKDLCPNKLTALAKLLSDVNSNFPSSLDEITLSLTPEKVTLSSYGNDSQQNKEMRTEMTLDPQEFEDFSVGVDTQISFSLKDLRAILAFAETCSSSCQLHFESNGKPLIVAFDHPNSFSVNFVMATYSEELLSHSQVPSNKSRTKQKSKRKDKTQQIFNTQLPDTANINDSNNICNASLRNGGEPLTSLMDSVLSLPPTKRVRHVLFEDVPEEPTSTPVVLAPDSDDDS